MVLSVNSSGRKGANSSALAQAALAATGAVKTATVELAKTAFLGCTGCGACRAKADACVLRDGLTPVLAQTAQADALIVAAPIYYGYVSGIFKSYLDRWYGFRDGARNLRLPPGRPLLCILTQGHPDPDAYREMASGLEKVFAAYGFLPHMMIAAGVEGPDSVAGRADLLAEAAHWGGILADKTQKGAG